MKNSFHHIKIKEKKHNNFHEPIWKFYNQNYHNLDFDQEQEDNEDCIIEETSNVAINQKNDNSENSLKYLINESVSFVVSTNSTA